MTTVTVSSISFVHLLDIDRPFSEKKFVMEILLRCSVVPILCVNVADP
jgi:hypothetical protein